MSTGTTVRLPTLPALVDGTVTHHRVGPVRHGFRHRVYQWLVDVDRLPAPPAPLRPFARFHAADHLGQPELTIRENVERFLSARGVELGEGSRIVMLANARVLGYVFDPLTVFWCLDASGGLVCVVAEVHNTYGDRHAYLLHPDESGVAHTEKHMYVSPFNDVAGQYTLRFDLTPDRVHTTVALRRDREESAPPRFSATFTGTPAPATPRAIIRHVLRRPLMAQRVSLLIRMHGIWLWLRRLPVVPRPRHESQEGV